MPAKRIRPPRCIGIVGSRRRAELEDYEVLREKFNEVLRDGDTLVSGGCTTGGDRFAETLAQERGLTITIHYPDWKKHGKYAGFERNTRIAEQCDILLALVAEDRTGGTEDTIRKATSLGKEIVIL